MKLVMTGLLMLIFISKGWCLTKEERKELFQASIQRLKATKIETKTLKLHDTFPDIEIDGKKISAYLTSGPILFTVYRGGWCPYCVGQLKSYQENLSKFKKYGVQILAVSPESELQVKKTKSKNNLSFRLISDKNHKLLRSLNLVFKVEEAVVAEYKNLGIDLGESQGNFQNELPIPATYLISKERDIIYAFVDADYTNRAKVEDILSVFK